MDLARAPDPLGRARQRERRYITVLFCDVVGSSRLAKEMEDEEFADLILEYRRRCGAIVAAHKGLVAQYLGDGLLAFFGYPAAHEDGAERAIRAALEIVRAEDVAPAMTVEVRVGIASGNVVIEYLREAAPPLTSGDGATNQPDVWGFGEALNLAAHLQGLAAPGTVVVSDQTRRVSRGVFGYQDLGRHELKDGSVHVWRVLGESQAPSRFHALRAADLTPLVNRREELQEIAELWRSVRQGNAATLLVSGEPGIGKSRLTDEAASRLERDGALCLRYSCSSHLASSPLAPVIRQLPRAARFADDDDDRAKLEKLERLVAAAALEEQEADEAVPLLARLLSVRYEERYTTPGLSAQRQRQRLFEILITLLKAAAARRPVLLIVEDLHWIDPSSDELLGMVIEADPPLPILSIVTARTEYVPQWRERARVHEMRLRTLDREDSLEMIDRLCCGHDVPEDAVAAIADRADGLPLFIEDLTRDILEMSELEASPGAAPPLRRRMNIPDTLIDTLMSRLDRLGPAKELARVGAVIGREFSYGLLARVAGRGDEELQEQIGRLVDSGLVAERLADAAPIYEFKHALVRDAAYATLLNKEKRRLHAQIADVLVHAFSETVDQQPETLAYHLQSAGELARAIPLWISAAKLSARRSGFVEAFSQLEEALRLCNAQPPGADRLRLELRVQLALGGINAEYRGFSSAECGRAYYRALEICRELGDAPHIFAALSGVGSFEITRGNLPSSRALAEECLRLAGRQTGKPPFIMGHLLLGGTLFLTGQFADSRRHLEQAIGLYEEDRASRQVRQVLYVQDQKATGLCYLGLGLTIMGYLVDGLKAAHEGVDHARALGAVHAMNFSLCYLAGVYHLRREPTEAERYATESLKLAEEQGFATWRGASQIMRGEALMALGSIAEGFAEIEAGVEAHSNMDASSYRTFSIGARVRGLLATGRFEEALAVLEQGLTTSDHWEERFYLAELYRLKGEALALNGRRADAEHWLREAFALACRQEARLFALRSAVTLCRVVSAEMQATVIREMLAPSCGWFGDAVSSPDLDDARAVLAATLGAHGSSEADGAGATSCPG